MTGKSLLAPPSGNSTVLHQMQDQNKKAMYSIIYEYVFFSFFITIEIILIQCPSPVFTHLITSLK